MLVCPPLRKPMVKTVPPWRAAFSDWAKVCAGVYRLDHALMVVLDIDKVLDLSKFGVAA